MLTEYRGLTVAQMSELRSALKGNATFTVTKNTLAKVAATEAGLGDQVSAMLSGLSAIAFVDGDVAQAAKGLLDFAKANPLLIIKGGVLDGKAISAAEVGKLADLEPREVLLAKLAGAMKATQAKAAGTFNALPTQMALLADALRASNTYGSREATKNQSRCSPWRWEDVVHRVVEVRRLPALTPAVPAGGVELPHMQIASGNTSARLSAKLAAYRRRGCTRT